MSTTVITCVSVLLFPQASVAVYVLVMMKVSPHVSSIVATTVQSASLQLSVTVAAGSGNGIVHSTVMSSAATITGAVVSTTVIT